MVSAFATDARLVLAQQKVDEKSNEIKAIPKLLNLLDLKGQIVTIDAMGTQKAIAKQIIEQAGDYVLALKGNQGTLNDDIRLFLETENKKTTSTLIEDRHEEIDKGHGRIEVRVIGYYIADFVCREKKLIIEVDGGQHMDAIEYDLRRTEYLDKHGYNVLRVWNHGVFNNIEGVLTTILSSLENRAT